MRTWDSCSWIVEQVKANEIQLANNKQNYFYVKNVANASHSTVYTNCIVCCNLHMSLDIKMSNS